MSGDVQPRKRKDKKKKREDDETKEQHQGVHKTKMGEDDIHLHVHSDHGTGGHWCAKIFFFALLAILIGLTGIIILENQGQDDVDTPLSESRFSNYFEGWVDEHRQDDHAHDPVIDSIEDHEDEHDDEPFEEEEDHSELEDSHVDDEDEHDEEDEDDEHADDDDEEDEEEATEEAATQEEDDEEDEEAATQEQSQEYEAATQEEEDEDEEGATQEDEDGEDDEGTQENDDNDEDDDDVFDEHAPSQQTQSVESYETVESREVPLATIEIEDTSRSFEHFQYTTPGSFNDLEEEERLESKEDIEESKEETQETIEEPLSMENNESLPQESLQEEEEQVVPSSFEHIESTPTDGFTESEEDKHESQQIPSPPVTQDDEDNDDDEDDVVDESNPKVVDNDAEELALLQEKARQQAEDDGEGDDDEDEENDTTASSIYVKLLIGVALALVARFVIFKRNRTSPEEEEVSAEALMKRRLTIAHPEEIPEEVPEEYSEEEIEIEEEIIIDEGDDSKAVLKKIVPESYKELENLYRQAAMAPQQTYKPSPQTAPQQTYKPAPQTVPPSQFVRPLQAQAPIAKPVPPAAPTPVKKTFPVEPLKVETVREPTPEEEIVEYEEEEIEYEEEYEDEEIEEELELEEEEEDVDDEELMRRLESKYGALPNREYNSEEDEDHWQRSRGGPQDFDDDDDDDIFEQEFRRAEAHLHNQNFQEAFEIFDRLTTQNPDRPKAFLGKAKSLDGLAELYQSNVYLKEAIREFKRFLAFEDELKDEEFLNATQRCVERMHFLGQFLDAANIQKNLVERFPNVSDYRNQLAISYLSVNRLPEAKRVLHETLLKWRRNGVALVHYGFVCKALDNNCENAVIYLREGIETEEEGTQDARFYFNLGDCLQRLGQNEEAREVFKKGADKKMFLSEYQRSLYNVENLKAQPFWTKEQTTYSKALNELERNWEQIKEEGLKALKAKTLFQNETENLRDFGDWKQFDLFMRGIKNKENCAQTPITCGIIESFPEARTCKRGQVKFSVMHPGTHVWPHCGPTNCRLRAHLGLVVPEGTKIRVAEEERSWKEGEFLIFDDSFEHEVWHTGSSFRLVLIVDVWHPDLTKEQRLSLSPI